MEQRKFKVIEILALQSGTSERGEWKSQEVILEEVQNVTQPMVIVKMKDKMIFLMMLVFVLSYSVRQNRCPA